MHLKHFTDQNSILTYGVCTNFYTGILPNFHTDTFYGVSKYRQRYLKLGEQKIWSNV